MWAGRQRGPAAVVVSRLEPGRSPHAQDREISDLPARTPCATVALAAIAWGVLRVLLRRVTLRHATSRYVTPWQARSTARSRRDEELPLRPIQTMNRYWQLLARYLRPQWPRVGLLAV